MQDTFRSLHVKMFAGVIYTQLNDCINVIVERDAYRYINVSC